MTSIGSTRNSSKKSSGVGDAATATRISAPSSGTGAAQHPNQHVLVTPPPATARKARKSSTSMQLKPIPKMQVEKEIVDELLLVCGVIGTTTSEDAAGRDPRDNSKFVPVTDCLNWLQDLQRALRRDDDLFRPISLLIGKWKVVEQKLLPLVLTCRYDTAVVLTVVKILVILTKPLAETTRKAGTLIIDTSSKSNPELRHYQMQLRDNALEQAQLLMDYKQCLAHHISHQGTAESTGLLSIFVSLLAEPLSKSGASRTDTDHLTIELVFHLFRNLLAAEPLLKTSSETSALHKQLHQEMIALFHKEHVLEILLVLSQDMEARENAQYNLLVMEVLHHMFKSQDPVAVANSSLQYNTNPKTNAPKRKSAMLKAKLQQEQMQKRSVASSRHGHFGGTWCKQSKTDGKTSYVAATAKYNANSYSSHSATAQRKNRKAEPFIGSSKAFLSHSRKTYTEEGSATCRANACLHQFCQRFLQDCYGPVMKSLKNEFRRDSQRLESNDKVVLFRMIWFFSQWWRTTNSYSKEPKTLGPLIFTMDVFTFNLVLTATDSYYVVKQHAPLAQAVALYTEMMQLLWEMYHSKDETESIMARGLLDRLFYGSEPMERLPKLLQRWAPGLATREYLCDLVALTHVTLKLLEQNQKDSQKALDQGVTEKSERFQKLRTNAAQCDVAKYFRKLITHSLVSMYTHLLGQYQVNSPAVNHRVLAMLLRIARTEIAKPEAKDSNAPINHLGTKLVTLEPMLYQMPLLMVLQKILNDPSLAAMEEQDHKELVLFATSIMHRFWSESKTNPMLFVECLFRNVLPHRHCDLMCNQYVSEELRMVAEKEMLLEEARRFREEASVANEDAPPYHDDDEDMQSARWGKNDDDDDDENEFDATFAQSTKDDLSKTNEAKRKSSTRALEDDPDDHERDEDGDATEGGWDNPGGSSAMAKDGIDEEEAMDTSKKSQPTTRKSNHALDEDSDDEEIEFANNNKKHESHTNRSARRAKPKVLLDDSDDEEQAFEDATETVAVSESKNALEATESPSATEDSQARTMEAESFAKADDKENVVDRKDTSPTKRKTPDASVDSNDLSSPKRPRIEDKEESSGEVES